MQSGQCVPLDEDQDGFVSHLVGGDDCDDQNPFTFPGAMEVMDGMDNDCDGDADEVATQLQACIAHVQQPHSNPLPHGIRTLAAPRSAARSIWPGLSRFLRRYRLLLVVACVGLVLGVFAMTSFPQLFQGSDDDRSDNAQPPTGAATPTAAPETNTRQTEKWDDGLDEALWSLDEEMDELLDSIEASSHTSSHTNDESRP